MVELYHGRGQGSFRNSCDVLEVVSQVSKFFLIFIEGHSIVWEDLNYQVIPENSGLPKISNNTQYFGLPSSRWVSKKLLGTGSGTGARWALLLSTKLNQVEFDIYLNRYQSFQSNRSLISGVICCCCCSSERNQNVSTCLLYIGSGEFVIATR